MRKKILIVEDNETSANLIAEILKNKADFNIAQNGNIAIKQYDSALNEKPYDLILLDIAMPELDGLEFLRYVRDNEKLKKVPEDKRIPIIMVTAFNHPFIEAFNRGCTDYIVKPIDPAKLLEKIENLIGPLKQN